MDMRMRPIQIFCYRQPESKHEDGIMIGETYGNN